MIAKSSKLWSSRDGISVAATETRRKERETGGKSEFNETKSPGGRKKTKLSTESMPNTPYNLLGLSLDTPVTIKYDLVSPVKPTLTLVKPGEKRIWR